MINIRTEGRNGKVVSVKLAHEADDAMFITESGMIVRTSVSEIGSMGRNTQGVRLVNLKNADRLVSLEIISESDLEREAQTSSRNAQDGAPVDGAEPAGEGSGEEPGDAPDESGEDTPSED